MPLPPVSTPFDYLITQIEQDLVRAAEICREIRRNRNVGHEHKQLDALENSLADGPRFIEREYTFLLQEQRRIPDVEGKDVDGGDDVVRIDFTSYVREVEEINSRLESIAYPPTHHHDHHRSLLFPSWDPHPHKDKEVPHFHELRLKWESVRDGIGHTFSQFIYRLELEAEKKKKEKKDKEKIDKEKKEAKEKADKDKKEAKEKADEELRKAEEEKAKIKRKLEEKEREDAERLSLKERHEQAKLTHHEEIAERRDAHVERLLQAKIEEDPIDQVRRVAGVFKDLQQTLSPRQEDPVDQFRRVAGVVTQLQQPIEHREDLVDQFRRVAGVVTQLQQPPEHREDPVDQLRRAAVVFNEFQHPEHREDPVEQFRRVAGVIKEFQHDTPRHSHENVRLNLAVGQGNGRAASVDSPPLMMWDGRHHPEVYSDHPRQREVVYIEPPYAPPVFYSPRSSFASSHHTSHSSHSPHHDPVVINNVIEAGIPPGDVEEIDMDGNHVRTFTGPDHLEYSYGHPRVHLEPGRRARTVSPRRVDRLPVRYGDLDYVYERRRI